MRKENQIMLAFLKANGINATPKYLATGSCKGQWRLYAKGVKWYDNFDLHKKLTELGFTDHDGKALGQYAGNGGAFSIFARFTRTAEFLKMMEVEAA